MKNINKILLLLLVVMPLISLGGCSDSPAPGNLEPVMNILEASDVTRNEAVLTVEVVTRGSGKLSFVRFRYGEDNYLTSMSGDIAVLTDRVTFRISGLKPGCRYFYRAEGGDTSGGASTLVRSEIRSFTTIPNGSPEVGDATVLSTAPVGMIVKFGIPDDGGLPIEAAGVRVNDVAAGSSTEYLARVQDMNGGDIIVNVSGLERFSDYEVTPFARNELGETTGDTFPFKTGDAIVLGNPGMLAALLGDDMGSFENLSISGDLNGDDFHYLRRLLKAPAVNNENEIPSGVHTLRLEGVNIVEGGGTYDGTRFTEKDIISQGLFANCRRLAAISLPMTATAIAAEAFENCASLELLEIPLYVASVIPSSGCESLTDIRVAERNEFFKSEAGVLYDSAVSEVVWFPNAKTGTCTLPSTVRSIGEKAFLGAGISGIELPASLETLGRAAFSGSMLERVSIPDGVSNIPYALVQGCSRLTRLELGKNVNFIGNYALDCASLTDLFLPAVPPYASDAAFGGSAEALYDGCTLHVPAGSRAAYRNHSKWGMFKTVVEY